MSGNRYKLAVVIGRFQPLHNGHLELLDKAYELADEVLVLIGSSHQPRNLKNPFTFCERASMIYEQYPEKVTYISPIQDHKYDDVRWQVDVNGVIDDHITMTNARRSEVVVVGHVKDDSSWYLKEFPLFAYVEVPDTTKINATYIRKWYFDGVNADYPTPRHVQLFLNDFKSTEEYENLVGELTYINSQKALFEGYPFPQSLNCCTADIVLECAGHILMIERAGYPYKGCMALVGGHKDSNETFLQCAIRELKEETGIKVPEKVLKGSIKASEMFDAPDRDPVMCKPSMTYYIQIEPNADGSLPRVKGADDAAKAAWVDLARLINRPDEVAFDHMSIIRHFTGI